MPWPPHLTNASKPSSTDWNAVVDALSTAQGSYNANQQVFSNYLQVGIVPAAATDALLIQPPALVASGTQTGGDILLRANSYDTTNHTRDFFLIPITTSNAGLGTLKISTKLDSGAVVDLVFLTSAGNLGVGVVPSQLGHFRKDQNTNTIVLCENQTAGSGAQANFRTLNDLGKLGQFGIYSSATTAYGALAANDVFLYGTSSITLMADAGSGIIKFASGGNSEHGRFDSSGNFMINKTSAASKLAVSGLPSYASNAAAITGGLSAGDFYTVTSSNPLQVAVVF